MDVGSPDELLTTDEVASHLKVSAKTVRNWRHAGDGPPARKLRGVVRYVRAEVDAWVASRPEHDRE
jgi:excisionase family DNA binding protein